MNPNLPTLEIAFTKPFGFANTSMIIFAKFVFFVTSFWIRPQSLFTLPPAACGRECARARMCVRVTDRQTDRERVGKREGEGKKKKKGGQGEVAAVELTNTNIFVLNLMEMVGSVKQEEGRCY